MMEVSGTLQRETGSQRSGEGWFTGETLAGNLKQVGVGKANVA